MFSRFKSAARILLKGDSKKKKRNPIPTITAEEVAEIKQFFPREKFFIFGHARSGTTLLMRLLRLHPEVYCNYQAHFFTRQPLLKSLVNTPEAEEWLTRKSNRWNQGRDLSPLVLRATADFIMERDAVKEGKLIVGDKSPSSIIHVTNGTRSIFTETVIRRVAKGWVTNVHETEEEAKRLFGDRYCSLRYEDMLERPFEEITRLWEFLGVKSIEESLEKKIKAEMESNPDEEWQAKRDEGIASFLPKGHAGNWERLFTAHDKALFKEVAGEMLIKWNYEKDLNW